MKESQEYQQATLWVPFTISSSNWTKNFWFILRAVKNLLNQSAARAKLPYPLCFSHLMRMSRNTWQKKAVKIRLNS